ncbi:MAG: hypothetical protein RDA78_03015 [Roseibium sp.]|uniref:hypothetical protein n=1 Tax=Roseibium sp. TaxID=1936156 RepID=UPI003D9C5CEE
MADLNQLETALRNAHKAGDVPAARKLAAELKRFRQASSNASPDIPDGMVFNSETGQYVDTAAAAERQNQGLMGQLGTAGAAAMEGVPIAGAYMRDVAGMGDPVQREIASRRMDQFSEERPLTSTGLQVAGAVAGVAPAVAAAPAVFGAGGGGLLANSLASGASGGVIGAADAAARSDGDLKRTAGGAGVGFGLGVLGPSVASGANSVANQIVRALSSKSDKAARGADSIISRALAADGMNIDDAAARLNSMGPDALPTDLPQLQQYAEGLAAIPGNPQKQVADVLRSRVTGSGDRITASVDKALGQPVNTLKSADDIIAQRSAVSGPLYEASRSKPVPFSKELEDLLARPAMKQALGRAQTLAANEGIPSQQWFINIADDGAASIRNVPDVRQLDYTKRALDDMITSAGAHTNEGRILVGLKKQLTGIIDDAVPEYAKARKAFAGPSGVLKAMEGGKAVFKNSQTPEQIRRTMAGMNEGEREAYTQGARAAIADIMGTARNDANAAKALFDRGFNKEKLSILVGETEAAQLLKQLDLERTFTQTRNQVTGNSRTAARQQIINQLTGKSDGPGAVRSAMNFNMGDAISTVGERAARAFNAPGLERRNEALFRALLDRADFSRAQARINAPFEARLAPERDAIVRALMATQGVNP